MDCRSDPRHPSSGTRSRNLQTTSPAFTFQQLAGLPPFQGGLAGQFGYGLQHAIERILRPPSTSFVPIWLLAYSTGSSRDHTENRRGRSQPVIPEASLGGSYGQVSKAGSKNTSWGRTPEPSKFGTEVCLHVGTLTAIPCLPIRALPARSIGWLSRRRAAVRSSTFTPGIVFAEPVATVAAPLKKIHSTLRRLERNQHPLRRTSTWAMPLPAFPNDSFESTARSKLGRSREHNREVDARGRFGSRRRAWCVGEGSCRES